MKKNLHRRKVRADLPPAQVATDECSITFVIPDIVGKNDSHIGGRGGGRFISKATKAYRASAAAGFAMFNAMGGPLHCLAHGGLWRLDVLGCWARKRSPKFLREYCPGGLSPDTIIPIGDNDAPIPQARDMLQAIGVIKDDCMIERDMACRCYRKGVHATVVRLSHFGAFPVVQSDMEYVLDDYLIMRMKEA